MNHTITAMFDDPAEAQAAMSRLVAEGVPQASVRLMPGSSTATTATAGSYDHRRDEGGFWASLKDIFMPEEDRYTYSEGLSRGGTMLTVTAEDADRERICDLLEQSRAVDLDRREAGWRGEGWAGYTGAPTPMGPAGTASGVGATGVGAKVAAAAGTATTAAGSMFGSAERKVEQAVGTRPVSAPAGTITSASETGATTRADLAVPLGGEGVTSGMPLSTGKRGAEQAVETRGGEAGTAYIPIVEERLNVGKRVVDHGRVRLRSYVVETPVQEQVSLHEETVQVDRRRVDRAATAADEALFAERTIEAEERVEEAVVTKKARVVEEVGLRKEAVDRTETVSDKVRRTEVEIEDERTGAARRPVIDRP